MIDKYLNHLTKEASTKEKRQGAFGAASIEELSKFAGIKLAEDVCPNCTSKMTKLGSIFKCACGIMKKAVATCPGGKIRSKGKGLGLGRGKGKGPIGVPVDLKKEAMGKCSKCGSLMEKHSMGKCGSCGIKHASALPPALAKNKAKVKAVQDPKKPGAETPPPGVLKQAKKDMPPFTSQDRPAKVKEIYRAIKRDHPDMPAEMKARIAARQGKKGKQKQGPPYKAPITSKYKSAEISRNPADWAPLAGAAGGGALGFGAGRRIGAGLGSLLTRGSPLGTAMGEGVGTALGLGGGVMGGAGLGQLLRRKLKGGPTPGEMMPGDFTQSMKLNPKSAELNQAFEMYETETGRNRSEMTGSEINDYIERIRGGDEVKEGSLLKVAAALQEEGFNKIAATKISLLAAQESFDLEKIAVRLEEAGMEKDAIGGVLKAIGQGAKGIWQAGRGAGGLKAGIQAAGKAVPEAARGVGEAAKTYGRGIQKTWQSARAGTPLSKGVAGPVQQKGLIGTALQTARAHPELLAAGVAVPAFAAGRMTKSSSASVFEVGDAAGRLLAKSAQGIPMEELQESMEEAKEREDIPGRAKQWQRAGGLGGALGGSLLGGGLGAGASKLLKGKGGFLVPGATALAGGLGGGYLGQRLGREHGAEEAAADKAISMLRAMRAHRLGAETGYGAGVRRGYMARQGTGE